MTENTATDDGQPHPGPERTRRRRGRPGPAAAMAAAAPLLLLACAACSQSGTSPSSAAGAPTATTAAGATATATGSASASASSSPASEDAYLCGWLSSEWDLTSQQNVMLIQPELHQSVQALSSTDPLGKQFAAIDTDLTSVADQGLTFASTIDDYDTAIAQLKTDLDALKTACKGIGVTLSPTVILLPSSSPSSI